MKSAGQIVEKNIHLRRRESFWCIVVRFLLFMPRNPVIRLLCAFPEINLTMSPRLKITPSVHWSISIPLQNNHFRLGMPPSIHGDRQWANQLMLIKRSSADAIYLFIFLLHVCSFKCWLLWSLLMVNNIIAILHVFFSFSYIAVNCQLLKTAIGSRWIRASLP